MLAGLIVWPPPLFAYTAAAGKIVVASDRPIPAAGRAGFLRGCERLLARQTTAPRIVPADQRSVVRDWLPTFCRSTRIGRAPPASPADRIQNRFSSRDQSLWAPPLREPAYQSPAQLYY